MVTMTKRTYDSERYFEAKFSCGHVARLVRKNRKGHAFAMWLSEERLCPNCYATAKAAEYAELAKDAKQYAEQWGLPDLVGREGRQKDLGLHKRHIAMPELLQIEHKIQQRILSGIEMPHAEDMLKQIQFWKQNRNPRFWINAHKSKFKTELKLISDGELRALCGSIFTGLATTSTSKKQEEPD